MHLVLGSERVDVGRRVVVIARLDDASSETAGADVAWLAPGTAAPRGVPFGADATTPDDVRRLADDGGVVVGLSGASDAACAAAAETGLAVLVPAGTAAVADRFDAERLLVSSATPVERGVAVLDLGGTGPPAWGRATVALAAGVRVVRTSEPRSIRRVAAVVERLREAVAT